MRREDHAVHHRASVSRAPASRARRLLGFRDRQERQNEKRTGVLSSGMLYLPQHPDLFTPGPYVSAAAAQGAGTHAKQYAITAYYILWHTPQPPKRKFGNGLVARQARAQQGPPSAAASSLGSPDV